MATTFMLWKLLAKLKNLLPLSLAFFSGQLYASGFYLLEHSATQMGHGYAGSTAYGGDASAVVYNPAAMSLLKPGNHVSLGVNMIQVNLKFDNQNSTALSGAAPMSGGNGGNAGGLSTIPAAFYAYATETWAFGLGVYVPFGLATAYDKDWVGRYFGIKSAVEVLDMNPAFSYRVNPTFTVAVGVHYQMLNATLSNALDMGTVCVGQAQQAGADAATAMSQCAGQGLAPQGADGFVEIQGDSTAIGWNLGFLFQPSSDLRLGLNYRAPVIHKVKGDADFENIPAPFTAGNSLVDTDAETSITLPSGVALGAHYQYDANFVFLGDITWTGWSSLDKLTIDFDSAQADSVEDFGWRNTYRAVVGAEYHREKCVGRAGLSYDLSPIPNDDKRNVRMPDSDRYWVSLGGDYSPMENLKLSIAYAHLFLKKSKIDRSDSFGHNVVGEYDFAIDIFGLSAAYQM